MARIIEFHIPDGFKPKIKPVTEQERGKLIVFPGAKVGVRSVSLPLSISAMRP